MPIVDFGLAEVHQPPRLRSVNAGAIPLAVALLTGRANAASRLHRPFRALADTYVALAFEVADEEQRADARWGSLRGVKNKKSVYGISDIKTAGAGRSGCGALLGQRVSGGWRFWRHANRSRALRQ